MARDRETEINLWAHEWLIASNFNKIWTLEDWLEHDEFDQIGVDAFNMVVNKLIEIDLVGGNYTWSNGFGTSSDHSVLIIDLIEFEGSQKPFQFYSNWVRWTNFIDLFDKYWGMENHDTPMFRLQQKTKVGQNSSRSCIGVEQYNDQTFRKIIRCWPQKRMWRPHIQFHGTTSKGESRWPTTRTRQLDSTWQSKFSFLRLHFEEQMSKEFD